MIKYYNCHIIFRC